MSGYGGIGSLEHERCQWQMQRVREGEAVEIYDFGHRKRSREAAAKRKKLNISGYGGIGRRAWFRQRHLGD